MLTFSENAQNIHQVAAIFTAVSLSADRASGGLLLPAGLGSGRTEGKLAEGNAGGITRPEELITLELID